MESTLHPQIFFPYGDAPVSMNVPSQLVLTRGPMRPFAIGLFVCTGEDAVDGFCEVVTEPAGVPHFM